MRSSLPTLVGVALAAFTIGLIAVEMRIAADTSPISITGNVTMNGQPLTRGTIRFLSENTPSPACDVSLIEDGGYAIPSSETLVPAIYQVQVSGLDEIGTVHMPEPLPSQYNRQSVLRVEIRRGGSHHFNFDLKR
jgi:hypothetical protein